MVKEKPIKAEPQEKVGKPWYPRTGTGGGGGRIGANDEESMVLEATAVINNFQLCD